MTRANTCYGWSGKGRQEFIRVRSGLMILASSSGTPGPAVVRLVAAYEDTVRDVIRAFNQRELAALGGRWSAFSGPARATLRIATSAIYSFAIV